MSIQWWRKGIYQKKRTKEHDLQDEVAQDKDINTPGKGCGDVLGYLVNIIQKVLESI